MKHQRKRYYLLTEDQPCWMWTRKEDNTLYWSIMGYNSKEVSPRKVIPEEDIDKISDDYAIEFADWLIKRQTNYFESLKELLEIFKKEKRL